MHPSLYLYNILAVAGSFALPAFFLASALNPKLAQFRPRLGLQSHLPFIPLKERGVWLHAVSVGEVGVASAIVKALPTRHNVTITSSTSQGLAYARKHLGLRNQVAPFPLDFPWAVKSAIQRLRPRVYVSLETEIWPNLLWELHKNKTKILMLNGRISPRSFPRYLKIKPLIAASLQLFSQLNMISQQDADRIITLGANPAKVRVGGNAKYAGLAERRDSASLYTLSERFNLQGAKLLVAGSVRGGEEEAVLRAFAAVKQKRPHTVLLLAPRHIKRAPGWLQAARQKGFNSLLWSELGQRGPQHEVIILDEMGQLFSFYGLASAAFVGASLVNKGGQNPLEPAAWGVPMAFGPNMQDFNDAISYLLPEGGLMVHNHHELAAFWLRCLQEPRYGQAMGAHGRQVVQANARAADNAAGLIDQYMEEA